MLKKFLGFFLIKGSKTEKPKSPVRRYVSEISVGLKKPARVISCGVLSDGYDLVGNQNYLRSLHGIDKKGLIKVINKVLK